MSWPTEPGGVRSPMADRPAHVQHRIHTWAAKPPVVSTSMTAKPGMALAGAGGVRPGAVRGGGTGGSRRVAPTAADATGDDDASRSSGARRALRS